MRSFNLSMSGAHARISDKGLVQLSSALSKMKTLEKIRLGFFGNEKISDKGITSLSSALGSLKALTKIYFYFTMVEKITNASFNRLRRVLPALQNLKRVYFKFTMTHVSGDSIKEMTQYLQSRNIATS